MVCVHPSCPSLANRESPFCAGGVARLSTAIRAAEAPLYPRGPRSEPGYVVPVHHHLLGPIRPTRGHITTSPHSGLYAMPSLCHLGLGDPRVVPCFHCSFLPGMPSSTTPGSSPATYAPTCATDDTGLRLFRTSSALPTCSHHPFQVGPSISGLHWFTFATACRVASLLDGSDRVSPAAETYTSGLSTRRSPFAPPDLTTVALGHFPLAGLSPAGTAASIAAP